ncbi:nitrate/nitrite transporter [Cellulophaga sp. HaHa_2_1]|uniref:MFS transporter n=1 Tax=Cellulophaga sp. HaHa_2_1 TaxID=2749994 RepID=UPI001C50180D|nr:MFS transporter [Cellulophaga sp. HaHa_2_1]QXP53562.1 MFS transporter [Cellulophaga sp. HaHa_2_1]
MTHKPHILPVLILAQFACTSLWFAGNAIVDDIALKTGLGPEIIGYVLSSVQFGFITGTLVFAFLMIADRFSPSKIFFICAVLAAACNLSLLVAELSKWHLLFARFGTGFFLAGIYPIGMKIAADYYENGLGKALGFLVGALVLGTSFPYLLQGLELNSNSDTVLIFTSALAVVGGIVVVLFVPNGPFRKRSTNIEIKAGISLFKIPAFRTAAIGYFGHMWELYAFWAFTPLALLTYTTLNTSSFSIPLLTFVIIALGGLSCALGGYLAQKIGSFKIAYYALIGSALFCILSPLLFKLSPVLFLIGWSLWGMAVTADSPQFSSLIANAAPPELKGTGLTLVNCFGFAISIISIQLLTVLATQINPTLIFLFLGIGPLIGLYVMTQKK